MSNPKFNTNNSYNMNPHGSFPNTMQPTYYPYAYAAYPGTFMNGTPGVMVPYPQPQQPQQPQKAASKTSSFNKNAKPFNPKGSTTASPQPNANVKSFNHKNATPISQPVVKGAPVMKTMPSGLNATAPAYQNGMVFLAPMANQAGMVPQQIPVVASPQMAMAPVYSAPMPMVTQPVRHAPKPVNVATPMKQIPPKQPASGSPFQHQTVTSSPVPPPAVASAPVVAPEVHTMPTSPNTKVNQGTLNLKPRNPSRRASISERPRDVITEEKIKEMNGSFATADKFVYVPELLSTIWEHTNRSSLVLPEDEIVHHYKWNISIRSKVTAQGILGEIQSLLNKLTLENFDSIYESFKKRKPTKLHEYRGIINLVYDKAVMEPHFSTMYAKLCRLMNRDYPEIVRSLIYAKSVEGGFVCFENGDEKTPLCVVSSSEDEAIKNTLKEVTVRRLIANKCQDELETEGKTVELEKQRCELKELLKQNEDDVKSAAELMEVEFRINTIRRRTFGNVQFIGELFNCGLLRVEAVIKASFDHLITPADNADDEKTEALCKLLTTVGKTMHDNPKFSVLLEDTVSRIEVLEKSPTLTSRVRFAVSDLIDLAENMWESDQKEKLEKLSDMRMKKTIEKLESIIDMLEKRTLSHHKSNRNSNTAANDLPNMKQVASEVVPADNGITQTKQDMYDKFSGSVRNALAEFKSSRDAEDFWYNIETKVSDTKVSMVMGVSAVVLYACENIKLESPEMTQLLKAMDYGFQEGKINEEMFIQGYGASLQLLDFMDSPSRFKICKILTGHFVEENSVAQEKLNDMLTTMEENPDFKYVISNLK